MKWNYSPKYKICKAYSKLIYCCFVLMIYLYIRKPTPTRWKSPKPFWQQRVRDYVTISTTKEIVFNSSRFVTNFAKKLGIPENPIRYVSMSGSTILLPQKSKYDALPKYIHVARILELYCDTPYQEDGTFLGTCFQRPLRSFAHGIVLNHNFEEIEYTYKGISYPTVFDIYQPDVGLFAGPEDARAILDPWDHLILSFDMVEVTGLRRRRMWTYNVTSGSIRQQLYDRTTDIDQKNWIPFFLNQKLSFIYSWNPFRLIQCRVIYKECEFFSVHGNENKVTTRGIGVFRGGSALYQYNGYYVASARISQRCNSTRVYRPHIVILSPTLQVIYVSEQIVLNQLFIAPFWKHFPTIESIPVGGHHARIMTSLSMIPTTGTDWLIEFSIHDQKNVVVVLQDFGLFLDAIIRAHKKNTVEIPPLIPLAEKQEICTLFE